MLRGWFARAVREQQVEIACTVRAHMAYLQRNLAAGELDRRSVATLLVTQVFLSTNFEGFAALEPPPRDRRHKRTHSDAELEEQASARNALLLDSLEVLQLFQRRRAGLLQWLGREGARAS